MFNSKILVERLLAAGIAKPGQINPCTSEDLHDIARHCPGTLPGAYLDFLSAVGRGAGEFMYDVDIYYPKMIGLNDEASSLLESYESGRLALPSDAFVFSDRYGEQFVFFHADGQNDNPRLYFYYEGDGKFRDVGLFWDFIEGELRASEEFRKNYPNSVFLQE